MDDCNAAETVSWERGSHRLEPLRSRHLPGSAEGLQRALCRRSAAGEAVSHEIRQSAMSSRRCVGNQCLVSA